MVYWKQRPLIRTPPMLAAHHEYILRNTSFASHLNAIGNGRLIARGCHLTSHRPSPDDGIFFFVRDVESGAYWSATPAPTFVKPESFHMNIGARTARVVRVDHSIETTLDILVPEIGDFEIRRITLANKGSSARRIEVTSSLDIILLFDRLRDSFHQTFSNMFIGAEFSEEHRALLYHRRFFDDPNRFPIFSHRIFLEKPAEFLGFETDREAFIGRGRPFGKPIALHQPLRNTAGYILDPLANLRAGTPLSPHESVEYFFVNSAHFAPHQPETFFARFPAIETVREFFVSEYEKDRSSQKRLTENTEDLFPNVEPFRSHSEEPTETKTPLFESEQLLFWNGFGGFDPETHDYRMRIRPDQLPPQPWANILANPNFGAMTTENSLGTTWFRNSKHGRLSPWSNNAVTDPPSEAILLTKIDTGETWSATPAPIPASNEYSVTHGRGFTRYEGHRDSLRHILTVSVDPEHPIKHFAIELENASGAPAQYALTLFVDAPHHHDLDIPHRASLPEILGKDQAILLGPEYFSPSPTPETVSIHGAILASEPITHTAFNKTRAFGPVGIFSGHLSLEDAAPETPPTSPHDACAIASLHISLDPFEKKTVFFSLIAGDTPDDVRHLFSIARESWRNRDPVHLGSVHAFWNTENVPIIQTPDTSLDILFNTWLPYQTIVSRMWGRIGFYQPGGAYGFRDQLQDAIALWYRDPSIARTHILAAAQEQYEDGNVRAWWSPDSEFGVQNKGSDHPLWLPFAVSEYIRLSGSDDILDEVLPFLPPLPDDPTRFDVKKSAPSRVSETLLEHCLRAIRYATPLGAHGLPLMRDGDWNDGMNRIGHEEKGESVWLGFFLFSLLQRFSGILSERGDAALSEAYREQAEELRKNLNGPGWDGHWFLRAFYDDGTPLGSEQNHECRIDAIAQAWSVLSRAGDPEKAREAMENLERFLYDPEMRILKLLDPPFNDLGKRNPGYIKDYPPGIRENGSQYNHAAFWAMEAFARLGRGDMVSKLLLAANPIRRSESERKALLYEVEPYVVAADIYSAEHRGKGGWTWYTASAGLMYRSIIETLFGIRFENNSIAFRPSLPSEWNVCSITLPWKSATLTFTFHAATIPHANAIQSITFDGVPLESTVATSSFPLPDDERSHRYELSLE